MIKSAFLDASTTAENSCARLKSGEEIVIVLTGRSFFSTVTCCSLQRT